MPSLFSQIKGFFFPESKKNILILGYKRAGKSTIIEQLIQQKILRERREETHGTKTTEISINIGDMSHNFKITDVGGSKEYQDMFWKVDIAKSDGIIYVIDSSLMYNCESKGLIPSLCPNSTSDPITPCGCEDNQIFVQSRKAKSFAFSIMDKEKPFLIFLNKMDLEESQDVHTIDELIQIYKLDAPDYNIRIEKGSALTGDNIYEAVAWLFQEMAK